MFCYFGWFFCVSTPGHPLTTPWHVGVFEFFFHVEKQDFLNFQIFFFAWALLGVPDYFWGFPLVISFCIPSLNLPWPTGLSPRGDSLSPRGDKMGLASFKLYTDCQPTPYEFLRPLYVKNMFFSYFFLRVNLPSHPFPPFLVEMLAEKRRCW